MGASKPSRAAAFAAAIFTSLVWGFSFLSIKVAVAQIPPITLALARFVMASLFLFGLLKKIEPQARLKKKDVPRVLLSGFVGVTLYFIFENKGIQLTSASAASIIVATVPIFTLLGSAVIYREKLTFWKIAGSVLSFVGVYLVVGANFAAFGNVQDLWGSLLMLGAVLTWVVYCFLTKPLSRDYSHLALATYQIIYATLTLLPLSLLEVRDWRWVDPIVFANVVFLGIVCSALGYVFYVYSQKTLGVNLNSLFINFIPVVTVTASVFILGERISAYQITGGSLVVLSVMMSEWDFSWTKSGKKSDSESHPAGHLG